MTPRIRAARPADMPAVYDLLSVCFPDARPGLFQSQTENDSSFRWRHARLVQAGERIVGYVRVFKREMWLRGARLRAAGIGSVATHPDYQRRGLASDLLRDTVARLRRGRYHLSFLSTGIPEFYERLGWRIVRQPAHGVQAAEAAALPERPGLTIRPSGRSDLAVVALIHAQATRGRTGAVVRSLRHWSDQLSWSDDDAGGFLVGAGALHGPAAYVRARSETWGGALLVLDAHCREGAEGYVPPLLGALGRHAVAQGLQGVVASLPEGHPLGQAFAGLPTAGMTMDIPFPLMMRALHLPGLLRRLAPLLDERLADVKAPLVSLAFDEDGRRTCLCFGPDGARVARRPAGETAFVSPNEAVTLLMGQKGIREVLAAGVEPPSEGAVSALEQLFPREPLHFSAADHI